MTFEEHYEFGHRTLPTWTFIAPRATGLAIEREEVDAHLARMGLKTSLAHEIREIHCVNGQTVKARRPICSAGRGSANGSPGSSRLRLGLKFPDSLGNTAGFLGHHQSISNRSK